MTAGTVMHKTRLSLRLWFWAGYLMATGTSGMSARQLQRQLALSRYDTAWTMLHKLRRAMVAPDRGLLSGEVEVDEFEIGGVEKGRSGGRSAIAKAASGIIAVEVRGNGSGRVRIELIDDASAATLSGFIERTVAPGAIVHTDGWQGYAKLMSKGFDHRPRSQAKAKRDGDTDPVLPRAHRAISNFKSWLRGTHRGVSAEHRAPAGLPRRIHLPLQPKTHADGRVSNPPRSQQSTSAVYQGRDRGRRPGSSQIRLS